MAECMVRVATRSPEETFAIGARLGEALSRGDVVGLIGELGAGKTTLTRGIVRGLECPDWRRVNSPTYVLEQVYSGRLTVHHYDAYRITAEEEFLQLGFEEHLQEPAVLIIEWADRVEACLPPERLIVGLEADPTAERRRVLTFSGERGRWEERLDLLFRNV